MRCQSINRRGFKAAVTAIFLMGVVPVTAAEPPAIKSRPKGGRPMLTSAPATELPSLGEGNTRFALDLYGRLKAEKGNLFFSPYSISTALAMTAAGAHGETLNEMTAVLHLPKDRAALPSAFKDLAQKINHREDPETPLYQLKTANALWGQTGDQFLPEFLDVTKDNFGATLHEVDFQNQTEAARDKINDWIAGETNDKIRDMIPSGALTSRTSLVLTNAIYFLGSWIEPFAEAATRSDALFQSPSGETKVAMMARQGSYAYAETPSFQAVEIPYAGGALGMVVLLPKRVDGLGQVESALADVSVLQKTFDAFQGEQVQLEFPKFKLTASLNLGSVLSSMGMPLAFEGGKADFSGISTEEPLYLSEVIHKAFVDVNEKGTEAAAATAVVMMRHSAMIRPAAPPISFKADHPFLFMIRERETGSILFLGRVVEPSK